MKLSALQMSQNFLRNYKKYLLPAGAAILILAVILGVVFALRPNHLTVSGLVQATEIKNASRFGGRVLSVMVKEGDRVKQGDKLVTFDDVDIQAKIAEAYAQLQQAQAQEGLLTEGPDHSDVRTSYAQVQQAGNDLRMLTEGASQEQLAQIQAKVQEAQSHFNVAQSAYENAGPMLNEGIISQQKYDALKAQLDSARSELITAQTNLKQLHEGAQSEKISSARSRLAAAQAQYQKVLSGAKPNQIRIASAGVEQAQSALDALKAQLSEAKVTAPISGVVSVLSVNPGELVLPNRPVISIIDDTHLWADVYVPEDQLDKVRVGQTVEVAAPVYPGAVFPGKIMAINPKSEFIPGGNSESSGEQASFRVKVNIQPVDIRHRKQLHPGMRVNVFF